MTRRRPAPRPPIERALARFDLDVDTGCWTWTGAQRKGKLRVGGRHVLAHHVIWEHYHGPLSEDHVLRSMCGNERCVNPDHLVAETGRGPAPRPLIERALAKITVDGECWIWTGAQRKGNGRIRLGGRGSRSAQAHHVTWEHYHGPLPDDHELRFLCGNSLCVNPDHLAAEAVVPWLEDPVETLLRGVNVDEDTFCWVYRSDRVECRGVACRRSPRRVSWERWRGELPDEMSVVVRCGNERCVNPDHLALRLKGGGASVLDDVAPQRLGERLNFHDRTPIVCKAGHWVLGENALTLVAPVGEVVRKCRACVADRHARLLGREIVEDPREAYRARIRAVRDARLLGVAS